MPDKKSHSGATDRVVLMLASVGGAASVIEAGKTAPLDLISVLTAFVEDCKDAVQESGGYVLTWVADVFLAGWPLGIHPDLPVCHDSLVAARRVCEARKSSVVAKGVSHKPLLPLVALAVIDCDWAAITSSSEIDLSRFGAVEHIHKLAKDQERAGGIVLDESVRRILKDVEAVPIGGGACFVTA